MFIKRLCFYSLIIISLISSSIMVSMNQQAPKKNIWRMLFRKGVSLTALGITLSPLYDFYSIVAQQEYARKNGHWDSAKVTDPEVRKFVYDQLVAQNVPNPEKIEIYKYDFKLPFQAAAGRNYILLQTHNDSIELKEFMEYAKKPDLSPADKKYAEKILNTYAGILCHEADHILNGDSFFKAAAMPILTVATHAGSIGLASAVAKTAPRVIKHVPETVKILTKIPTAYAERFTKDAGMKVVMRPREQKADNGINEANQILGLRDDFAAEGLLNVSSNNFTPVQKLLSSHPTDEVRVKKLDEHLDWLEQQGIKPTIEPMTNDELIRMAQHIADKHNKMIKE